MRLDLFIARRLQLRDSKTRRSSFAVRVAVTGVALSVAVMLLTLAIVKGFKQQITDKIIGFDSQISITALNSDLSNSEPITLDSILIRTIRSTIPEATFDLSVIQPAMLKTDNDFYAVIYRAHSNGKDRTFLKDNIVEGVLPDFDSKESENKIVISRVMADALALAPGDKINSCFFINDKLRVRNFEIAAIYESNFGEYDKIVTFCSIPVLQRMLGLESDQGTRVEINNLPFQQIEKSERLLSTALMNSYYAGQTESYYNTMSVLHSGALYFHWLELLDTNVFIIIILMSAISIFTLISSLFILILEKVQLIGTLKTLGASNILIRRIFIILASRIMLRGLLAGNIAGLLLIALQYFFRLVPLNPEGYYISFVPMRIGVSEILILNAASIVVAVMMMVIPSGIITRMNPAKTVRFE